MRIQRLTAQHLDGLARHSRAIGWYGPNDWRCFLETGTVLGHVDDRGAIQSSGYVSQYPGGLGWLGAFIVSPAQQGRGLGRALLDACLAHADLAGLRLGLVSTIEGMRLYESAGFSAVSATHKLVTERGFRLEPIAPPPSVTIRALAPSDEAHVRAFDRACVAADREPLLRAQGGHAIARFAAVGDDGSVRGYVFVVPDGESGRLIIGPLVADSPDIGLALSANAIACGDGTTRIDLLREQAELIDALRARGFALERECPVMTYAGTPLDFDARYRALVSQGLG